MTITSRHQISRLTSVTLTFMLALLAANCGGKKTPLPPPPPPPNSTGNTNPTTPTSGRPVVAEFVAEPSTIERGQSAQLRWNVTGSSDISISNGIGTVPASGSQRIDP